MGCVVSCTLKTPWIIAGWWIEEAGGRSVTA